MWRAVPAVTNMAGREGARLASLASLAGCWQVVSGARLASLAGCKGARLASLAGCWQELGSAGRLSGYCRWRSCSGAGAGTGG